MNILLDKGILDHCGPDCCPFKGSESVSVESLFVVASTECAFVLLYHDIVANLITKFCVCPNNQL